MDYDKQALLNRFQYNAYFISHYLSIGIRKQKYLTDGTYNSIGVYISFDNQMFNYDKVAWKCLHDLHCSIIISNEEFDAYLEEKDLVKRYEFYLSCLERGYDFINTHKEIPVDLLLSLHDEFRKNGYKNEILFKQLCYKPLDLKIVLTRILTTFDFRLAICAYNRITGELLAEGTVFRTAPDDIFYAHCFKGVQVIENKLVIIGFLNRPFFIIDIPALSQGRVDIQYGESGMFDEKEQIKQNELIQKLIW